ncbi:hypothetical protein LY76DRAFT_590712 [Colletotrichum caudatum]|nr:hypothetical protein LY76DRAFT_590712 [Colletotrichum caudatum]
MLSSRSLVVVVVVVVFLLSSATRIGRMLTRGSGHGMRHVPTFKVKIPQSKRKERGPPIKGSP